MKVEDLLAVVIKSAGDDFSIYLPDRNVDPKVRALEDSFIAYDLGKTSKVTKHTSIYGNKGGSLSTYDENGKLIRVEEYIRTKLPLLLYTRIQSIPWMAIVNDKYLYSQEDGDVLKKTV
jgi:hypothetical protein